MMHFHCKLYISMTVLFVVAVLVSKSQCPSVFFVCCMLFLRNWPTGSIQSLSRNVHLLLCVVPANAIFFQRASFVGQSLWVGSFGHPQSPLSTTPQKVSTKKMQYKVPKHLTKMGKKCQKLPPPFSTILKLYLKFSTMFNHCQH